MNILVFSWRDPIHPMAGGAEQSMHEHMKGWIRVGNKVTLFASRIKGNPKHREVIDGVEIIRRGFQMLGVQIAAFFWYVFGKHERFDLVIDEFHGIPFFTPFYVGVKKMAVLQEVARGVWLKNDLHFPFNYIFGLTGYIFEPLIFLFYKKIPFMVGSISAKAELEKMGISGANISVVHHGVTIPKSLVRKEKSKIKTVMFLGALAKDKGIEDALRCFALLNKLDTFNFWVVGRGGEDYLSSLKAMAKKLELKGNIKFWGYVDQVKKFELLSRAHVLVNPSFLEGWGLVNIEANAVGTPVIAYNSPGLTDSVQNGVTGVICVKNSPESMAGEVEKLLRDEVKYQLMSREAIRWANSFSWEKSRRESLKLIDSIMEGGYS